MRRRIFDIANAPALRSSPTPKAMDHGGGCENQSILGRLARMFYRLKGQNFAAKGPTIFRDSATATVPVFTYHIWMDLPAAGSQQEPFPAGGGRRTAGAVIPGTA